MVIVLTKYEKKTLFSFFALYVGSVTILLTFIMILFFNRNYESHYKQLTTNMKMQAQELCTNIVMSDMEGTAKNQFNFPISNKYNFEYLSKNEMTSLPFSLQKGKHIYTNNETIYYVEPNTKSTWGIDYIILEENKFLGNTFERIKNCIVLFGSIYSIMILIGYILARFFIQPIVEQRKQLNNFIKDTTHELNTPISAIVMSINDDTKELSPKGLQRIKYSVKRITEIYSDMTYLFLEGNSETKSFIQEYNLKTILDDQIIYFSKMAENKNQSISFDTNDYTTRIDKEDFIRLSNNLITNAIKYTPKGGDINIILKENSFIVQDNGQGIPQEEQQRIYERFYRSTDDVGGFGIGLNIVNNICKKYQFTIELTSAPNNGTTFKVIFSD